MGKKITDTAPKRHRKTKAALAAGAVASTVAVTAAYRRRNTHAPNPTEHRFAPGSNPDFGAGPDAGPGSTQPL